jgi:endonuclease/exonuclease/phosphatase family metal-dependent hydrolase
VVAAWNVRVGGGDLPRFLEGIRAGAWTEGDPPSGVVLLVQETFRSGLGCPGQPPDGSRYASRIADRPPAGDRRDIVDVARRSGLSLFYAPSMRNGGQGDPPEDRGNAILSTLPLEDATSLELPFERQRRVVATATVSWSPGDGSPLRLRCSSVHLDNRAPWRRMSRTFGAARARQARGLAQTLARLPGPGGELVGGDLNTWYRQTREEAFLLLRAGLPHPSLIGDRPTHHWELGLDRQSDYLMARMPAGWTLDVRRLDDEHGSDHYPLVGVVRPQVVAQ